MCTLQLPFEWSKGTRLGPRIKLSLPSFSGGTLECPHLLKYSCDLQTNVMILPPAIILGSDSGDEKKGYDKKNGYDLEDLSLVLGGKPIVTLAFDRMKMRVDEPSKLVLEMTSKGSRSKQLIQH